MVLLYSEFLAWLISTASYLSEANAQNSKKHLKLFIGPYCVAIIHVLYLHFTIKTKENKRMIFRCKNTETDFIRICGSKTLVSMQFTILHEFIYKWIFSSFYKHKTLPHSQAIIFPKCIKTNYMVSMYNNLYCSYTFCCWLAIIIKLPKL